MRAIAFSLMLTCTALAQDEFKVAVKPFEFGRKATMRQLPDLELWHIPGDVYDASGTRYFSNDCWRGGFLESQ